MVDPTETAWHEQRARVEKRISELKAVEAPRSKVEDHHSQAHLAWRMVIELVAGLGIGFGIGYGLDVLFGTLPIFMVLFILLGFVAGVRTMMRTAKEFQVEKTGDAPDSDEDRDNGS